MFATNAALQIALHRAAFLHAHRDQLTHAFGVERIERVARQDFLAEVVGQKGVDVVSTVAEGHLGEVVGAEAKEIGLLAHLVGGESRTGDLNHRADQDIQFAAVLLLRLHFFHHFAYATAQQLQFRCRADQWDHNFRLGVDLLFLTGNHRFGDRGHLHVENLGVGNRQTATAMTEHRIGFVQCLHPCLDCGPLHAQSARHFGLASVIVGQELVQRRIEQADGYRH